MRTREAAPIHVNVDLLKRQLQLVHITKLLRVFLPSVFLVYRACGRAKLNLDIL